MKTIKKVKPTLGLKKPQEWMYMYSSFKKDFFKNINFRNYISFEQ